MCVFLLGKVWILLSWPIEIKPVMLNNDFQLSGQSSHELNPYLSNGISVKLEESLYGLLTIQSLFESYTLKNLHKHRPRIISIFSMQNRIAEHFENSPEPQIVFVIVRPIFVNFILLNNFLSSGNHFLLSDFDLQALLPIRVELLKIIKA